jgi:hypothetical protein
MRHQPLALLACLAITATVAEARPGRHRHHKANKPKPVKVDVPVEAAQIDIDAGDLATAATAHLTAAREDERIEIADEDIDEAEPVLHVRARRPRDWHVAIGPYLWASSVDANVSLGDQSVGTGIDFIDIQRHAKYGIELQGEARYRRFAVTGDFMYGVVGVDGKRDVGPLMVTVGGEASSMLVDGFAGYTLWGGTSSVFSIEARAGVRYQRTAISGSVVVEGNTVASPSTVDAAADGLAGTRVFVRPWRWLYASAAFDTRVAGASTKNWSASTDASVQITKRLLLSVGWRTLTTERANVSLTMHGPRAALQLLF